MNNKEALKKEASKLIFIGIPIMPVKKNKVPFLVSWTDEDFNVSEEDMHSFIDKGLQMGIITGKRSGITVVDIDFREDGIFGTDPDTFPETYTVRTPSGAIQKYYQYTPDIRQSQKLFDDFPCVDIRNDGGQVVAPPSHMQYSKTYASGASKEINAPYEVISGTIANLAPFPVELFTKYIKEEKKDITKYNADTRRPGDDFDQTVSWDEILTPNGWKRGYTDKKGITHWTRPNKKGDATSATTGIHGGRERLFVFSSNAAPFEQYSESAHNSYTKVTAYAQINHQGDFAQAVQSLRAQGFGLQHGEQEAHKEQIKDTNAPQGTLGTTCMLDIIDKPIEWVWKGKIARGELCIIAGEPGAGKTMIAVDIAARISRGDFAPFSEVPMAKGSVLFLTSENDPAKVLRPRLHAAGADLNKVFLLSSTVNKEENGKKTKRHVALAEDAKLIGDAVESLDNVVALIIDPITEYMGKKDANSNADVRDMLATLTDYVRERNVAVIAVSHLNKKVEVSSASARISGSIGFAGAARTAFAVARYYDEDWSDEQKEERDGQMAFSFVKNNLSEDKGGFVYKVRGVSYPSEVGGHVIETACVEWIEESYESADEMLANKKRGRKPKEVTECAEWLAQFLQSHPGGVPRFQVIEEALKKGISRATVDRASDTIAVMKERGLWRLVDKNAPF